MGIVCTSDILHICRCIYIYTHTVYTLT